METVVPTPVVPELTSLRRVGVTATFLGVAYALLCGLVILAVYVAKSAPLKSTPLPEELMPWQAIALILSSILVAFLLIRKIKARVAWELVLGMTLFLGVWFYAWILLPVELALTLAAILTFVQGAYRRVWIHDVFMLVGAAGVALNFAFALSPITFLIILVGLAIYDTFAGRPGGVVAEFAASLVHRGVIPGLIVPGRWRHLTSLITDEIRRPDALFLGAGDLILPLALVARAAASGMWQGATMSVGLVAGAIWLGTRGPTKPFPALVPLAAGTAIPFLILLVFKFV